MRAVLFVAVGMMVMLTPLNGQSPSDTASVTAFYQRWMGSAAKGYRVYASFYAADGYILPPNSPPVVGRDAIASWFEKTSAAVPYTSRPQGINVDEVRFLTPDWVIHRSTLSGQRVPKAGGDGIPFETKYFDVLHRTAAGDWEVVARMWSENR
jgi:uncharacterized protein (TIGR02246 family)